MHPRKQLIAALNSIIPVPWTGVAYRSISEAALNSLVPAQPLYSLGARKKGQRFTPKNGPACLYLSEQFETSYVETNGTALSIISGVHFIPPPTVIVAIQCRIEHVLDLTLPDVQASLETNDIELSGPWFEQLILGLPVHTHILARAAYSTQRFQAIRFTSAQRPGATNLMIWTKKITSPSFIEVHDPSYRLLQRIPPAP